MNTLAPVIEHIRIRNYKSIASSDTRLGALTILVGPNGSGKSNFLDALAFVSDALSGSLDHALRSRGGINDVRRRSHGRPNHFSIRIDFRQGGVQGHYAFTIGAKKGAGFEVRDEECSLNNGHILDQDYFRIKGGKLESSTLTIAPAFTPDRLYLVRLSGEPNFRPVFDLLSKMGFYSLVPDQIREIQPVDEGLKLLPNGSNLASVYARMTAPTKKRMETFLESIVPGIRGVSSKQLGGKETLEFRQETEKGKKNQIFLANNMSDGTLRALGILAALFQGDSLEADRMPLVGIEEPEVALHPAAAGVLFDVLREASSKRQVLVTSHSPDLLDNSDLSADNILSVEFQEGATKVAPISEAGRSALRDRLYTPGELLRLNQLIPDPEEVRRQDNMVQGNLFER